MNERWKLADQLCLIRLAKTTPIKKATFILEKQILSDVTKMQFDTFGYEILPSISILVCLETDKDTDVETDQIQDIDKAKVS